MFTLSFNYRKLNVLLQKLKRVFGQENFKGLIKHWKLLLKKDKGDNHYFYFWGEFKNKKNTIK